MRIIQKKLAGGGSAICVRLLSGTWPAWSVCLECNGASRGGGRGSVVAGISGERGGRGKGGKGCLVLAFVSCAVVHQ